MRNIFSEKGKQHLREDLISVIKESGVKLTEKLGDHTSLIKSGAIDSVGLFTIALFVENEIPSHIDITAFDLAKEWDSISGILNFIERLRGSR